MKKLTNVRTIMEDVPTNANQSVVKQFAAVSKVTKLARIRKLAKTLTNVLPLVHVVTYVKTLPVPTPACVIILIIWETMDTRVSE